MSGKPPRASNARLPLLQAGVRVRKAPKTPDLTGFSALWMAHPEEFESPTYCLGVLFRWKLTVGFRVMQWQKPQ